MSKNLKISIGMVLAAVVAMLVVANLAREDPAITAAAGDDSADRLVRPDSLRLSVGADEEATFVEFLDFECEACRAAYPAVEELTSRYGDRVTFVVRHFPLHVNSEAAARAAEAAAEQGQFEAMYDRLFQTQPEWGEKTTSQEGVFFGFAEELGLDMSRFRAQYDHPATIARIRRDAADGRSLGVGGTPTFFLDGEEVDAASFADLVDQIDDALDD